MVQIFLQSCYPTLYWLGNFYSRVWAVNFIGKDMEARSFVPKFPISLCREIFRSLNLKHKINKATQSNGRKISRHRSTEIFETDEIQHPIYVNFSVHDRNFARSDACQIVVEILKTRGKCTGSTNLSIFFCFFVFPYGMCLVHFF